MKMYKQHFDHMKAEIDKVIETYGKDKLIREYETGDFARSERVKDLQRRLCFDLIHGAGLSKYIFDNLYPYLNDEHIYTALKKICPKVQRKF